MPRHLKGNNTLPGSQPGNPLGNPFPQMSWPDPSPSVPEDIDHRDYVLKPGEDIDEKIQKNLFLKVQVDKNNCFVGEPVVATYKLYSRVRAESRVTKHPSLNGFSVYDMVDPGTDPGSVEKLNVKPFIVRTNRKAQLVPLQPGTIDLDPAETENTVHFFKGDGQQLHRGEAAMPCKTCSTSCRVIIIWGLKWKRM